METRKPGHETRDVDIPRITILAAGLVAMIIVALLLMVVTLNRLAARETRAQRPRSPIAAQMAGQRPPEPRLQSTPRQDLAAMRAEEDAALTSYGWVDRNAGVVRIPVDEAMKRIVSRGLPVRPAPAAPETR